MSRRRFAPRSSKTILPDGWSHVPPPFGKENDRHTYYRCPQLGTALTSQATLEWRRCVYVCRKDQIPEHPSTLHPHAFSLAQEDDPGFPKAFQAKITENKQRELCDIVLNHIAMLTLRLGLTISQGAAVAMKDFVTQLILVGAKMGNRALQIDLNQVLEPISVYRLRQRLSKAGLEWKSKDMAKAREVRFVNIACDSGTVLGKTVIHALLTNPYSDSFPMVLQVIDNTNFTGDDYCVAFNTLCEECFAHDLIVCGVIIDNLRAQVNGLHQMLEMFGEDPMKASILHIPCFAHMTNLVFIHAGKKSSALARIVKDVSSLVTVLRKPGAVRELGEKCASICETRWLYIVDILIWMFRREEKINAFLLASDNNTTDLAILPQEWKICLRILEPLKWFTLRIEASQCALWEVVELVEHVMRSWQLLLQELSSELTHELLEMFTIVVDEFVLSLKGNSYNEVIASYSLSECGRERLRVVEEGFQTERDSDSVPPFRTDRMSECEDVVEDDVEEGMSIETSFSDEATLDPDPFQSLVNEEADQDAEREDSTERDLNVLLNSPVYDISFETALLQLTTTAQYNGLSTEYMYDIFRTWLFADRATTPTRMERQCSPDVIWRRAPSHDENWRAFSAVAMRYVTLGASEADCERSLSTQRTIQGLHITNISTPLLESRLRALSRK